MEGKRRRLRKEKYVKRIPRKRMMVLATLGAGCSAGIISGALLRVDGTAALSEASFTEEANPLLLEQEMKNASEQEAAILTFIEEAEEFPVVEVELAIGSTAISAPTRGYLVKRIIEHGNVGAIDRVLSRLLLEEDLDIAGERERSVGYIRKDRIRWPLRLAAVTLGLEDYGQLSIKTQKEFVDSRLNREAYGVEDNRWFVEQIAMVDDRSWQSHAARRALAARRVSNSVDAARLGTMLLEEDAGIVYEAAVQQASKGDIYRAAILETALAASGGQDLAKRLKAIQTSVAMSDNRGRNHNQWVVRRLREIKQGLRFLEVETGDEEQAFRFATEAVRETGFTGLNVLAMERALSEGVDPERAQRWLRITERSQNAGLDGGRAIRMMKRKVEEKTLALPEPQ